MIEGVLVVDKPAGITSHDVVDRVRKVFGLKKVGHAGTLDPDATGVLVLGLGRATRILSYAQAGPKSYAAVATLGVTTSTLDAAGDVLDEREVDVTEEQVRAAAARFVGAIQQIPPMVSAVKVGGERLYKKARRGEDVERPPRAVTIHRLDVTAVDLPEVHLDVRCSGGTYIRTLIADIGTELGCGAHMKSLRRTEAAGFPIEDAIPLDSIGREHLRPLSDAVRDLTRLELDAATAQRVAHGQRLPVEGAESLEQDQAIALLEGDELIAVYKRRDDTLVPDRVLVGGEA